MLRVPRSISFVKTFGKRVLSFVLCAGVLNAPFAVAGLQTTCMAAAKHADEVFKKAQSAGEAKAAEFRASAAPATTNTNNQNLNGAGGGLQQATAGLTAIGTACASDVNKELEKCNKSQEDPASKKTALESINKALEGCNSIRDPAPVAAVQGQNVTNAADQIGQSSSSNMMGWLIPGLIGAGLGALLGSMLGGGDDSSSSSSAEESPPTLAETPTTTESSSSASTLASASVSQSSESISQPAIVVVPTVEPGDEAGDKEDEILIAASGAIPDPDVLTPVDSSGDNSSLSSDAAGGTTTIGGTTGNESPLDTSAIAANTSSGTSVNSIDDSNETVAVGLAAGQGGGGGANRPAPFMMYGESSSSEGLNGNGSGMLNGVPSRLRTGQRSLAGASSSFSSKSSSSASAKSSSSSSQASVSSKSSSSVSSVSTSEQRSIIMDTLRAMGLIGRGSK